MVVSSLRFYPPPPPPFFRPPEQRDVLIFQSFLLQKRAAPSSILEGSQAVYSVKLNGPPPTHVAIELNASDQLTRFVCLQCKKKLFCPRLVFLSFLSLSSFTYLPFALFFTRHILSLSLFLSPFHTSPHSPISMYSSPPSTDPSRFTFHLSSYFILHSPSPALHLLQGPYFLPDVQLEQLVCGTGRVHHGTR